MRKGSSAKWPSDAVGRAEALLDKWGDSAGTMKERLAQNLPAANDRSGGNGARRSSAGTAGEPEAVIERAEETVDRIGRQIGEYLAFAGKRISIAAAYAQEEAEDMLAEAQNIRARRAR